MADVDVALNGIRIKEIRIRMQVDINGYGCIKKVKHKVGVGKKIGGVLRKIWKVNLYIEIPRVLWRDFLLCVFVAYLLSMVLYWCKH